MTATSRNVARALSESDGTPGTKLAEWYLFSGACEPGGLPGRGFDVSVEVLKQKETR